MQYGGGNCDNMRKNTNAKRKRNPFGCFGLLIGGIVLAVAAAGNMGRVTSVPAGGTTVTTLNTTRTVSDRDRIATANAQGAVLASQWRDVAGVEDVTLATVLGDEVYGEIVVERDAQSVSTAEALADAARAQLMSASLEFDLILDNGLSASDYRWSNVTDSWSITPLESVTRQPTQGVRLMSTPTARVMGFAAPRTTCNGVDDLNCSDFVTGSAAATHIATCGDEDMLDRDGDGRACEGG